MQRTDTSQWPCTIARSADILGDGWNLLIIRQACLGTRRFDGFQRELGIGRNILANRLERLVADEVLMKVQYDDRPVRHEYRLTQKGREIYPILAAMGAWGNKWLRADDTPPLVLHHAGCDHDMEASVVCGQCGQPLEVRNVTARYGPRGRQLPPDTSSPIVHQH